VTWQNWAGDQSCEPAEVLNPESVDDVAAAATKAAASGRDVRVVGAGHSFSPAALTSGTMLSLDRLNKILDLDRERGLVRVEAGIRLRHLNRALDSLGLALENLGDIDVQSIAGATATGTHGTGGRLRNLSASIHGVQLVTADGSILELDEETDSDGWRAARVSIGALGVVTALTLRCVPAFTLRGVDKPEPLDDVLHSLDELVENNEHFEFYTFPHSPLAHTRTNNRVDEEPSPRSRSKEWFEDIFLRNHVLGALWRTGRRFPAAIPPLSRTIPRLGGTSVRVESSYRIFASPRLFRFTEMEYALPRDGAAEAVRAVREIADRRDLKVLMPIEVRFVAPDDAFLSPASHRDTCYVAVHVFEGMEWRPYFDHVEAVMTSLGGRPHWGKRHSRTADDLRSVYPDWDRFAVVRDRLDPERRFTNDYVRTVLGP
jgi:L-gulonolactone oxidase